MKVENLAEIIGSDFYTGVPDSQLKALCNYLMDKYGIDPKHHIIAANEGNCTSLAAGYHLATGKIPVVYMQNSGEGNIINPVASLLNDKVYAIPVVFIVGWRGEPGVHDEPQHIYQGEVTVKLLDDMGIESFIIGPDTTDVEVAAKMDEFRSVLDQGKDVAFVIRKGALTDAPKVDYKNDNLMTREEIIEHIVKASGEDPIVSTTGKASRELFEIRERNGQSHKYDFLTVGSMGHASSIALGVAINKPDKKIWCIDGDGAALMHMGAMAVIGSNKPKNLVHIVINNGAHETVGGMPTVAGSIELTKIARACGYANAVSVSDPGSLDSVLKDAADRNELSFVEVMCSIGARDDLGRPTSSARENKEIFMHFLAQTKNADIEYAQRFYMDNFDVIANYYCTTKSGEHKIYVDDEAEKPYVCRFCGKSEPDVTFRKENHAISELIGNKTLFLKNECDLCNIKFGKKYEDQFAKYLGPARSLTQTKGKNGIPSYKSKDGRLRIDFNDDKAVIQDVYGDNYVKIEDNVIHLNLVKDTYIPMHVFKALVFMALSVMPANELMNFDETIQWLNCVESMELPYDMTSYASCVVERFVEGGKTLPIHAIVLKRKTGKKVPFSIFILEFDNYIFQIIIPCPKKDKLLDGKKITFYMFPSIIDFVPQYVGLTRGHNVKDFSSTTPVKGEKCHIDLKYDYKESLETDDENQDGFVSLLRNKKLQFNEKQGN